LGKRFASTHACKKCAKLFAYSRSGAKDLHTRARLAPGQKFDKRVSISVSTPTILGCKGGFSPTLSHWRATMSDNIKDRLLNTCSIIAEAICDTLEAGKCPPWIKTFKGGSSGNPENMVTGYPYGGVFNPLILGIVAEASHKGDGRFAGYGQLRKSGNPVRKGETGTDIFFPKFKCSTCEVPLFGRKPFCSKGHPVNGDGQKRWAGWGVSRVFNNQQTVRPLPMPEYIPVDPEVGFAAAAKFFGNIEVDLTHAGGRAFYAPKEDRVQIPEPGNFLTVADYWAVRSHETAHWTGHADRLNRKGITEFNGFGSEAYAYEELVAEMGSAFLCHHLGVEREGLIENHAAYIASWKKRLKEDPMVVRKAASDAGAILRYLVDKGEGPRPTK